MLGIRVIPCLLLRGSGLVKTRRFRDPTYVGDPVNTTRIFNDKEVDELVVLDIEASKRNREPNYELLSEIATECFVPLGYGGALHSVEQMRKILRLGFEKVILNSSLLRNPNILREAADAFGSQSVVASIDVKRNWRGKPYVFSHCGLRVAESDPVAFAEQVESLGAGEILLNAVDRDGWMNGYDVDLIQSVSSRVKVPVIACGGAATTGDLSAAVRAGGASATAAGSMFVFQGRHRAVLISFPTPTELEQIFPERAPDRADHPVRSRAA